MSTHIPSREEVAATGGVETTPNGTTVFSGANATRVYQLIAQRSAMKLEIRGMHHSSGRSVIAMVKRDYGFTGNKQRVLEQFEALLRKKGIIS